MIQLFAASVCHLSPVRPALPSACGSTNEQSAPHVVLMLLYC